MSEKDNECVHEKRNTEREGLGGEPKMIARKTDLNIIKTYVTWSIPLAWTNSSSSSVADMKSNLRGY
jgi:hypothetical protein